MRFSDFIFPGVTLTVENIPDGKADLIKMILLGAHDASREFLEAAAQREAEQRRLNAKIFN